MLLLLLQGQSAGSRLAGTFQIKTAIVRARLDRPFICIQSCSKQRQQQRRQRGSSNNEAAQQTLRNNVQCQCSWS